MNRIGVRFWLILVVVAGLALRAFAIAMYSHAPESDELSYRSMALNLIGGNGIVDQMGNRAMYSVGYPLLVLAPIFAVVGDGFFAPRVANLILGGLSILLCYAVAKESGAGPIGGHGAAALWALYLPTGVYSVYLAKENLMTPLILGVMWCALRLATAPSSAVALCCGLLSGLLALVGSAGLAIVSAVALGLMLSSVSLGRKMLLAVLMVVAALVVALPWVVRNMQVLGAPVLNTNGGFNLYLGNNPAATGMFVSISDTPRGATWGRLRDRGEVFASKTLEADAILWIRENTSDFVVLALKKGFYFWSPPFHQGQGEPSRVEQFVRMVWAVQFLILVVLATGSAFVRALRNHRVAILWLSIASYTAVHMLYYVIFRYRLPIMPIVCVLAGMTLERFVHARRWRIASST